MKHLYQVNLLRETALELCRAVSVLALLFLSFAHQPIGSSAAGLYRLADGSLPVVCGQAPTDQNSAETGSCDACRITGAIVLPQRQCGVRERIALAHIIEFSGQSGVLKTANFEGAGRPRAPPVAV